jgi:sucrose-6-phosphate hydrolase SacC (GH32 family)
LGDARLTEGKLHLDKPGAYLMALRERPDEGRGEEQTRVYYDAFEKQLKMDTAKSSLADRPKNIEAGPCELKAGEPLKLRVFVDKSVLEVFANEGRQAVMRRIYPTREDSVAVRLFSTGGPAHVATLEAWEMMPSNPY